MRLTFPYIFKPNNMQKEIIEDIIWHCEKVYNTLNYDIYQGKEIISIEKNLNIQSSKIYKKYRETNWHSKYLHSHTLQEIIINCISDHKSYMALKEKYNNEDKSIKGEPRKPRYKKLGKIQITFTKYAIRLEGNTLKLSISKEMQEKFKVKSLNFLIPRKLKKLVNFSAIKMIKIRKDRENKYKMEMIYEREEKRTEGRNVMAIDLGLDNLAACTNMNNNETLIIAGENAKSKIGYYNKEIQRLQRIQMKMVGNKKYKNTKQIEKMYRKRKQYCNTYMHKASRMIVNYAKENECDRIIIGNIKNIKQEMKNNKRIEDDWKTEESSSDNTIYKYYYPTSNTMIMVMFEKDGNYGDNSNIDSIFLDSYISGMNLEDKDIISQEIKIINNVRCGVIRCYINDYEFIQYIILNNNEAYVFSFAQANNLNDKNIEVIENIIKKSELIIDVENQQQVENGEINEEVTQEKNSNTNIRQQEVNTEQKNTNSNINTALTNNSKSTNTQNNKEANNATSNENTNLVETPQKQEQQINISNKYQTILNEYSQKLKSRTPSLITEYKNEASKNTNGLNGLATICNNKVSILAEISTEGIGKMADIYYKYGNGKYSEYEEWAGKLQDVYMSEAEKIQDVYLESAM